MNENNSSQYILSDILSDKDLMELSEDVPMPEGGTLEQFIGEAGVVEQAIQATGVKLPQLRPTSRALFLMRAFYLLGVLRGGEAYRNAILAIHDEDWEEKDCPFSMVGWIAEDVAENLNNPKIEDRNLLVQMLLLDEAQFDEDVK